MPETIQRSRNGGYNAKWRLLNISEKFVYVERSFYRVMQFMRSRKMSKMLTICGFLNKDRYEPVM